MVWEVHAKVERDCGLVELEVSDVVPVVGAGLTAASSASTAWY